VIDRLLKEPESKGVDWMVVTGDLLTQFTSKLTDSYLVEAMHKYGQSVDESPLGDKCPSYSDPVLWEKRSIWDAIRLRCDSMRQMMARKGPSESQEEPAKLWDRLKSRLRSATRRLVGD